MAPTRSLFGVSRAWSIRRLHGRPGPSHSAVSSSVSCSPASPSSTSAIETAHGSILGDSSSHGADDQNRRWHAVTGISASAYGSPSRLTGLVALDLPGCRWFSRTRTDSVDNPPTELGCAGCLGAVHAAVTDQHDGVASPKLARELPPDRPGQPSLDVLWTTPSAPSTIEAARQSLDGAWLAALGLDAGVDPWGDAEPSRPAFHSQTCRARGQPPPST